MTRKVTVNKINWISWSCESLFGCLLLGAVIARAPVCSVIFKVKIESISVEFPSLIVAVFERIAVEYTWQISWLSAAQLTVKKSSSVKVKSDHRSKFFKLSHWKEEAWKKHQSFNGIRTSGRRDTSAMLYQLSYEATHCQERGQFYWVDIFPCSEVMWSIYEIIKNWIIG